MNELHIGSLVKADYPKKLIVDCKDLQEADDGDTSYFGGSVMVGETDVPAHGNDRGDNYQDDVFQEIAKQLGIVDVEALFDALDATEFVIRADAHNEISMPNEGSDQDRLAGLTVKLKNYKKTLE